MASEQIEQLRAQARSLAQELLPDPEATKKLVKRLQGAFELGVARRLLDAVLASEPRAVGQAELRGLCGHIHGKLRSTQRLWMELVQLRALCTYKDNEIAPERRFRAALAILESIGLRDKNCRNGETLGQGGAIYKRLWETGGELEHLHTALAFYHAAWERDPEKDMGWGGVNAAYCLDLLAFHARATAARESTEHLAAPDWSEQASALRRELLERLPALAAGKPEIEGAYWYRATLAEVHFGLREYEKTGDWLSAARETSPAPDEWELQTTTHQLAAIARLQGILPPAPQEAPESWDPAWRALARLFDKEQVTQIVAVARHARRGKVGLALSGGGFRAALFHLGVLARLAECDVLPSVETLSTVSGGSIVGAHYYLELCRLLETHCDGDLGRRDYVELVRRVMDHFLEGVQQNLRTRALVDARANLRMLLPTGYSRSNRMGELYEQYLYARVPECRPRPDLSAEECGPLPMRRLRDLLIYPALDCDADGRPKKWDEDFKPRSSNWRRLNRVPNLMINTTSLNSGHNWQFTASWMGEPPGLMGDEVDMNERYRRLYYHQAPSCELRNYPLCYAVAASSCVPALFEPLVLKGLYPGRTVRLVDGGVHDNQGVAGLLDDDCNFILCSDASGQIEDLANPKGGMLGVFFRSDGILQDRVREAQYQDLRSRADSHSLQGLFFIHLKQELETAPIDWVDCDDPQTEPRSPSCTSYGVDRDIQRLLSEIRTDLDTFTEVESYALMASGYLLTENQLRSLDREHREAGLPGTWGGYDVDAPMWQDNSQSYWPFAPLLPILGKAADSSDLRRRDLARQLKAASRLFGKVWVLVKPLRLTAKAIGAVGTLALVCCLVRHWGDPFTFRVSGEIGWLTIALLMIVGGAAMPVLRFLDPRKAAESLLFKLGLATIGWLGTSLHLWIFDPLLRRRGSLKRLLSLPAED